MIIFSHLVPSYVRLTNGLNFNEGRVEVYHQGVWGPVCREGWSQSDSSVACRELGFNVSDSTGGNEMFVSKFERGFVIHFTNFCLTFRRLRC